MNPQIIRYTRYQHGHWNTLYEMFVRDGSVVPPIGATVTLTDGDYKVTAVNFNIPSGVIVIQVAKL